MTESVADYDLWRAKKACSAYWGSTADSPVKGRRICIEQGEIVEFRFHDGIHFRTKDDLFLYLDEKEFYDNFQPHGKILEKIKWENKATTEEILRLNLYDKATAERSGMGEENEF